MRKPVVKEFQKEKALHNCFSCMVELGIEQSSMRDFSRVTGLSASSLYYWFDCKEQIVIDAVQQELESIVKIIFSCASSEIGDFSSFLRKLPNIIKDYKKQLRTIIQVSTSPQYGDKLVEFVNGFDKNFDRYAAELSRYTDIDYNVLRVLVDVCISSVVTYVVWDNQEKFIREIENHLKMTKFK